MKITNFSMMAHVDAGKTSLTEAILYKLNLLNEMGTIKQANTQTDTMEEERLRGITIKSTPKSFYLNNQKFNLIDTPGHAEFISEVRNVMDIIDFAILIISNVSGIQSQTRLMIKELNDKKIPTILFINKIDLKPQKNEKLYNELISIYGNNLVSLNNSKLRDNKESILNTITLNNQTLLNKYVNNDIERRDLLNDFINEFMKGNVTPIIRGSAKNVIGVNLLLDFIKRVKPVKIPKGTGKVFKIEVDFDEPNNVYFHHSYYRLNQKKIENLLKEKYGKYNYKLYDLNNNPINEVYTNDIYKIKSNKLNLNSHYGREIKSLYFSSNIPLFEYLIISNTTDYKLLYYLELLSQEDLQMEVFYENSLVKVRCHGEIYIEVIKSRLERERNISIKYTSIPNEYIESVIDESFYGVSIDDKNNHLIAGISIKLVPLPENTMDNIIKFNTEKGLMKKAFYNAIMQGIRDTLSEGRLGWRVFGCEIIVESVEFKSPVTTTKDFKILTSLVLAECIKKNKSITLEMFVKLDILVPDSMQEILLSYLFDSKIYNYGVNRRKSMFMVDLLIPKNELTSLKKKLDVLCKGHALIVPKGNKFIKTDEIIKNNFSNKFSPFEKKNFLSKYLYNNVNDF